MSYEALLTAALIMTLTIGVLIAAIVYMAVCGVPRDAADRMADSARTEGFVAGNAAVNKWWTDLADTGKGGTLNSGDTEYFVFTRKPKE